MNILTEEELKTLPVASKTMYQKDGLTDKYEFSSTLSIVNKLMEHGWKISKSYQRNITKSTKLDNYKFAKHWITFRKEEKLKDLKVDDVLPQIYVLNSHDGTTALKFESGLYRVVCSNGLVTPSKDLIHLKLRHSKEKISQLNEFLNLYLDTLGNTINHVNNMSKIELNEDEKMEFANISSNLRWGQYIPKINLKEIIIPRRYEDNKNDLWTVYNVIQENLTKGGIKGLGDKVCKTGEIKKIKTRKLIDENKYISFNSDIWQLALNKLQHDKFNLN